MPGLPPSPDVVLPPAGEPAAVGMLWAAAVEVPADAARTVTLWYAVVALLGLVVLLGVAVLYGWRRRR